jgi:hypothetical protein
MRRSQCQAWAEASGGRCKKTVRRGFRYCWMHQSKLPYLLGLILSAVTSFAANRLGSHVVPTTDSRRLEALNDAANRKPVFKIFLNDKVVADGASERIPVVSGSASLQFTVQNTGTAPAADFEACVTYPAVFSNVVPAGWKELPPPKAFDHDRILPQSEFAHYSVESKSPMAQGLGVSLPPITITNPRPMVLSFMVWSGTSEKVRTTLNLTFDAKPSSF